MFRDPYAHAGQVITIIFWVLVALAIFGMWKVIELLVGMFA